MLQLIKNARLIDGRSSSPVERAAILIDGDKIAAAGPESGLQYSAEYQDSEKVIDAGGKTIVPGLINVHEHIIWRRSYGSWADRVVAKDPTWFAIRGAANCLISLREGVTTVRDVGAKGNTTIMLKRAIEDGIIIGPRMMVCGQTIAMTGGHAYETSLVANGPDETRKAARELLLEGADFIKLMGSGGGISKVRDFPWSPQFTVEEMRAAFEEAHNAGKKTTIHCHPAGQIRRAVEAGVDCIEHGALIDVETAEFLAEKGVQLVPTLSATESFVVMGAEYGRDPESIEQHKRRRPEKIGHWRRILETGVILVSGVDSLGDLNMELELFVEIGMSPIQAIQAGTSIAAETIDMGDKVGTIEPGKYADLFLVSADPLEDIKNLRKIEWVMKGGMTYTPAELSKAIGPNLK
ncbi:MAG TPA: amidohydrolase family protein [Chloroflexi bacterium]|nr:amidohydrolase family protein [Chloroflexota bacterium]